MSKSVEEVLGGVFTERKAVIRGRVEGPRRPKRSQQKHFLGRGYGGEDGKMKGAWLSGEYYRV
jgi:hypothetical protein